MVSAMRKFQLFQSHCGSWQVEETINISQNSVSCVEPEPTNSSTTSTQSLDFPDLEVSHLKNGNSDAYLPRVTVKLELDDVFGCTS